MIDDELLFQRIYKKHTSTKPCVVPEFPNAMTVWLDVGNQHFCLTAEAVENEEQAEFMRKMVAEAMVNLINEHCGSRK